MLRGRLISVLITVQEQCRPSYGVTSIAHESYGCVWHLQHRRAGDAMVEVPLRWMSGAIVSDYDMISKIRARHDTRNRHGYNSISGLYSVRRSARA